MKDRKIAELEHNKEILEKNELVFTWGWNGPAGKKRLQRRADLITGFISSYASRMGPDNAIRILEIGCGTGLLTEHLPDCDRQKVFSFDIYDAFVKKTMDKTRKLNKSFHFLVSDAEYLPFADGSFDIVVGLSVLHHLKLDIAQREINRVLKPGGGFIFSEPNMLNPQIFIQKNVGIVKKYMGDSLNETAFYPTVLNKSFAKHGLNIDVQPFDFLHPKTPGPFIPIIEKLEFFIENKTFLKYIAGSLLIQGEKICKKIK